MSQTIFDDLVPGQTSGSQLAQRLNDFKAALLSGLSGTSRPTQLQAGGLWVDTSQTATNVWVLKMYTGTIDVNVVSINIATGSVGIAGADSSFRVSKASEDSVGPILAFAKQRLNTNGQVQSGDVVSEMQFFGHDNTTSGSPLTARLRVLAQEAMTASGFGVAYTWEATPLGSSALNEMMRLQNGRLGINTPAPLAGIHLKSMSGIRNERASDDTSGARLVLKKSRIASTGMVQSGDTIGTHDYVSTDNASADAVAAQIQATATQDHNATGRGTRVDVKATKTNATSATTVMSFGDEVVPKVPLRLTSVTLQEADVGGGSVITALPASSYVVRITGTSDTTIDGIAPADVSKVVLIQNASTGKLTINPSTTSTAPAANQILLPDNTALVIPPNSSAEFFYSTNGGGWRVRSATASGKATSAANVSVTPSGNISSTNVQSALVELQGDIDSNANAISTNTSNITTNTTDISGLKTRATTDEGAITSLQTFQTSATTAINTSTTKLSNVVAPSGGNAFEIASTSGGFKPPSLTTTQRDAISSPVAGLQIFNSTTNKLQVYNGTAWLDVGSGTAASGGSGINYIKNSDAETDVAGWSAFTNSIRINSSSSTVAVSTDFIILPSMPGPALREGQRVLYSLFGSTAIAPLTSGTVYYVRNPSFSSSQFVFQLATSPNGTPIDLTAIGAGVQYFLPLDVYYGATIQTNADPINTQITRTTTSPLRGTGSFLANFGSQVTGGAANGVVYPFTIDSVDVSRLMEISFDYTVDQTLVDGDLQVAIIDTTTKLPVSLSENRIFKSATRYYAQFTATANTTYQFVVFYAPVSNTSYSANLYFDNVRVGPASTTQTAYINQPDSLIQINTFALAGGTTWANAIRLTSPGYTNTYGDAMNYVDDAATGLRVEILKEGIYSFQFSCNIAASNTVVFAKNITQNYTAILCPAANKMGQGYGDVVNAAWTGPLVKGDIIRILGQAVAVDDTGYNTFSAAYVGSVKAVTAISGSKITIPSSELKFEGGSVRGTTDTYIAKFDNLTKLVGDAWTITNNTVNGTILTARKAGVATISCSYGGSATIGTWITKNQQVLTTTPLMGEILASGTPAASNYSAFMGWTGRVVVGDQIRIAASGAPTNTANNYTHLAAFFWEDSISLALNTVQPQWAQGDSYIRVTGSNGAGTTNTTVPRFSNVVQNSGTAITYSDSATLGAYFTINEDGVYSFKYVAGNSGSALHFGVGRAAITTFAQAEAAPSDSLAVGTTAAQGYYATLSGQEFLTAGTVIRPFGNGASNMPEQTFSISKIGKPNLTSVDVTPFATNYKTADIEVGNAYGWAGYGTTNTAIARFTNIRGNTNKGIISYIQDTVNGDSLVVKKACQANIEWTHNGSAAGQHAITINSPVNTGTVGSLTSANILSASTTSATVQAISVNVTLAVGDVIRFHADSAGSAFYDRISWMAIADTDSVVSANKQISSDSMSFAFKSTAIDPSVDPVGTYNVYTYAASGNVTTLSTTAPTQTSIGMNQNGLQLFARPYNAASTAASPARIQVYLGKGLKAVNVLGYKSAGKVTSASLDQAYSAGDTVMYGLSFKEYNEYTGILTLDAGYSNATGVTTRVISAEDGSQNASVYLVINASANPALLSVPVLNRTSSVLATGSVQQTTAATPLTIIATAVTQDTDSQYNAASGIFTARRTGNLDIAASVVVPGTTGGVTYCQLQLYKNNVAMAQYSAYSHNVAAANLNSTNLHINALPVVAGEQYKLMFTPTGYAPALSNAILSFSYR